MTIKRKTKWGLYVVAKMPHVIKSDVREAHGVGA